MREKLNSPSWRASQGDLTISGGCGNYSSIVASPESIFGLSIHHSHGPFHDLTRFKNARSLLLICAKDVGPFLREFPKLESVFLHKLTGTKVDWKGVNLRSCHIHWEPAVSSISDCEAITEFQIDGLTEDGVKRLRDLAPVNMLGIRGGGVTSSACFPVDDKTEVLRLVFLRRLADFEGVFRAKNVVRLWFQETPIPEGKNWLRQYEKLSNFRVELLQSVPDVRFLENCANLRHVTIVGRRNCVIETPPSRSLVESFGTCLLRLSTGMVQFSQNKGYMSGEHLIQ